MNKNDLPLYAIALFIGTLAGAIGAAFHLSLDHIFVAYDTILNRVGGGLSATLIAVPLSAMMAVLAVWLTRRFAPEAAGSGIQEIEGAMEDKREVFWLRALLVKFFGGLLALGSGLVLGREGPTIHMGAAIAKGVSDRTNLPEPERRGLLAAGAAAGLAAAFNAPLAAIVFVTEEMQRIFPFHRRTYIALIIASAASAITAETLAGRHPLIDISASQLPLFALPLPVLLGAVIGMLGVIFNHVLLAALNAVDRLPSRIWWLPAFALGGASGLLLVVFPEAVRGGEGLVLKLSAINLSILALILLSLLRFSGSILSYASGTPGGIFAPMLAIAASVGLAIGALVDDVIPLQGVQHACAIFAMGAFFAASVRAPIVAVILLMELTAAYELLLPLLIACATASVVAHMLGGRPIYAMLLERTLSKVQHARDADASKVH